MWLAFALAAALLTSFLPIINKRLMRDTQAPVVAWSFNALSLPLLAAGTLVETRLPAIDATFVVTVAVSGAINWLATLASMRALDLADASLVTPLLTFNPPFSLAVGFLVLGERPTAPGLAGVLLVALGAYLFEPGALRHGPLAPLRALLKRPGVALAILASFLWALTPIAEKIAIRHTIPENSASVALATTVLMVVGLTISMRAGATAPLQQLRRHPFAFAVAGIIAGIAPLFGFAAIGAGLVGYVTALFKLSAVATVLWSGILLREEGLGIRLPAALVMAIGAFLIAQ